MTNILRAQKVQAALEPYLQYDDKQCAVIDLLADLMHHCQENGIDFTQQLETAQGHFQYETTHPEEENE